MSIYNINKGRAEEIGQALIWAGELARENNTSFSVIYMDSFNIAIPIQTSEGEGEYGWEVIATVS